MRGRSRRRRSGYTLLEVIVAFAVLTFSLSALLPTMSATGGRAGRADVEWAATEFARSKLDGIGIISPLRTGIESGSYRDLWQWQIVASPYRADGLPIGLDLFEIVVEVRTRDGQRILARLVTIRRASNEGAS